VKIVIFSTKTKHHTYFINKLNEQFNIVGVLYERFRLKKDYPTGPVFEREMNQYEEKFFDPAEGGVSSKLSDDIGEKVVEVYRVNQTGVDEYVKALEPDIGITFGVGPVKPHVFNVPKWGTINIHRGVSQEYRGLDSDLWAIYHNQYDKIGVTIHYVDDDLDTGGILAQEYIKIGHDNKIYHLRYIGTVVATRLVLSILADFKKKKASLESHRQEKEGSYYSAIPLEKEYVACNNFIEYTKGLHNA